MPRLIAFLRAINVGGHTVAMGRLRELFAELGLTDVETFIASGNVIFSSRARDIVRLESRIAGHLRDALGFEVATFVRSVEDLRRVLDAVPFRLDQIAAAHAVMVGFLATSPDRAALKRVTALSGPDDALVVVDRELYWLRRSRESDPALAKGIERALGAAFTIRNANTIRRLQAKYGA